MKRRGKEQSHSLFIPRNLPILLKSSPPNQYTYMILLVTTPEGEQITFNNPKLKIFSHNRIFKVSETDFTLSLENLSNFKNPQSKKPLNVSKQAYKIELW